MKIKVIMLSIPVFLSACTPTEHYSASNMSLFAALYGFEAIEGPVKELRFYAKAANNVDLITVQASFDHKGCLSSLSIDGEVNSKVVLKKLDGKISGVDNGKKVIFELGEHCVILNKKAEDGNILKQFTYNESNRLSIDNSFDEGRLRKYSYDASGKRISGIETMQGGKVVDKSVMHYKDPENKYLDYFADGNGPLFGRTGIKITCQYHDKTPTKCQAGYAFLKDDLFIKASVDIKTTFY